MYAKRCMLFAVAVVTYVSVTVCIAQPVQAGVPDRTARRWLARYRADGAVAFVQSGRVDRGGRRIPVEMVGLIEGLAFAAAGAADRAGSSERSAVAGPRGLAAPPYQSVRQIVQGLDRGLLALAQHGPDV